MKNLKDIILEKLIINKNTKINKYHYHPTKWSELKELVKQLIKERGNDADLNDIDTSKITDMSDLFSSGDENDFDGDISEWDVSNVEKMEEMFENCKFNGDISNWDVSKVKHMRDMFLKSPLEKNPPKWYKKS